MATPNKPVAFTRLSVMDPRVNQVVQDIYDKLAQVLAQLDALNKRLDALPKP